MANFKINKIRDYFNVSRNNLEKDKFKCACCKRKTSLANAKLAYIHSDVWNGHQGVSIYAYRLCPDCKKEKDIKDNRWEVRHDKLLKLLGVSSIIWGIIFGIGLIITFISIGNDDGKTADLIAPLIGEWLILPFGIMIIGIVSFGIYYLLISIKSFFIAEDGIDFNEALKGNAVHWYINYYK